MKLEEMSNELKNAITQCLWDFTDKHLKIGSEDFFQVIRLMQSVLGESVSEVEMQIGQCAPLTQRQQQDICFKINAWSTEWEDKMWKIEKINEHWLSHAVEDLKNFICGEKK